MLRLFEKRHEAEYFSGYKLPKCQSWAGKRETDMCWNRKYRTEAHEQNELCTVTAVAIQFGLKYFDIYGIRSDSKNFF